MKKKPRNWKRPSGRPTALLGKEKRKEHPSTKSQSLQKKSGQRKEEIQCPRQFPPEMTVNVIPGATRPGKSLKKKIAPICCKDKDARWPTQHIK
jgi:hypothetical protein